MFLVVGLGNPEEEYSHTRHNMGFDTINILADKYGLKVSKRNFQGLYTIAEIEGKKVILLKPQTYMNLSGKSIKEVMDFYKISPENILVIYDDMDIEKGIIKIRKKGGPGSHNGMKSIVSELKTEEFPRIRVGVGRPENDFNKIDYVIGHVPKEEQEILAKGAEEAAEAVEEILRNGLERAMNKFN